MDGIFRNSTFSLAVLVSKLLAYINLATNDQEEICVSFEVSLRML